MAGRLRVVAWIAEAGWEACAGAAAVLPAREITLLHVTAPVPPGPVLLGRHPPPAHYDEIAEEAAEDLLAAAAERLRAALAEPGDPGRALPAIHRVAAHGRPEDIVIGACTSADVLVLARSGLRPGPHSLEHATRFVVDHAPCTVVLTWP